MKRFALLALSLAAAPMAAQSSPGVAGTSAPRTYGTSAVSYVRVPAPAFYPESSSYSYGTGGSFMNERYSVVADTYFLAPVPMPSGAKVTSLRLDFEDDDPDSYLRAQLVRCDSAGDCLGHPVAGVGPPDCLQPLWICTGTAFQDGLSSEAADLTPDDITIDNLNDTFYLRIRTGSGSCRIVGMVVGYVLQVSPPPAAATFNDVPTSHPFFQFVEALMASGITAGCGSGDYCPDAPLTRGQMAVFLSKALGLQWP